MLKVFSLTKYKRFLEPFFLIFYLAVALIDSFAVYTQNIRIEVVFKPLITMSLLLFYVVSAIKIKRYFIIMLVFFCLGDVLLIFNHHYLLQSMLAFSLGVIIFTHTVIKELKKVTSKTITLSLMPYIISLLVVVLMLEEGLKELFVPIVVYSILLSCFGVSTFLNYLNNETKSNKYIFIGAFIFSLSSIFVGINLFLEMKVVYELVVIISYTIAMFLVTKGVVLKNK